MNFWTVEAFLRAVVKDGHMNHKKNTAVLQASSLGLGFYHSTSPWIVSGIDFSIYRGQTLALVGESGSGKTVTAKSIVNLFSQATYIDKQSKIIFNQKDLFNCSELELRDIRGQEIAMIFQDALAAFNPVMPLGKQMLEAGIEKGLFTKKQARSRSLVLLDEVGIPEPQACYDAYPHQCSGGMLQRVMIAMALMLEPTLLIADEPTTSLDVTIQAQVINLLMSLQKKHQMALLFITHDLALVKQVADHVMVMQKGKLVEKNTAKDFFLGPKHPYSQSLLQAACLQSFRQSGQSAEHHACLTVGGMYLSFNQSKIFWGRKQKKEVVKDVCFALKPGKTLALIGESGSGKTTIARAIVGLHPLEQGNIFYENKAVDQMNMEELRKFRQETQLIMQNPYTSMNPRMLVADIIAEGVHCKKDNLQQSDIEALLALVGLPLDYQCRYPHALSGGERQRVCIARALAMKPKILICDEPTSALDVSIQAQIIELLTSLQKQYKIAMLLITHNFDVVASMADEVLVLAKGEVVERGQTQKIMQDPQHLYTQALIKARPLLSE
jgi:peptide/nickel transport system ATP-binding protein